MKRGTGRVPPWAGKRMIYIEHAQARAPQGTYLAHPELEGFVGGSGVHRSHQEFDRF